MVVLKTIEEWQKQSALLLQARPTTTRISTKYHLPNLDSPRYKKNKKRKNDAEDSEATAAPRVPRAVLVLKTFDPESGVCLRFKTDKAADVGRLVGGLGRLGRHMAALPAKTEDAVMEDAPAAENAAQTDGAAAETGASVEQKTQQGGGGGGGGKKKKKSKK